MRNHRRLATLTVVGLLGFTSRIHAASLDVPSDFSTIAAALAAAAPGDTVRIACGTWFEHDMQLRAGVVVRGETGAADCVTIDAQGLGRIFSCTTSPDTTHLEGLTLRGGTAGTAGGGAVLVDGTGSFAFRNCLFTANQASSGSCVRVSQSRLEFDGCSVTGLTSGGSVLRADDHAELTFRNCDFSGNPRFPGIVSAGGVVLFEGCGFADNAGAGPCIGSSGDELTVLHCTFRNNNLTQILTSGSVALVDSCTFVQNPGVGVRGEGGTLSLSNCAFSDGAPGVSLLNCDARMTDCSISRCLNVDTGGALVATGGSLDLARCLFEDNEARESLGGAVYLRDGTLTADECVFRGNRADMGGAIRLLVGTGAFSSCRFEACSARQGGGMAVRGSAVTFDDCLFDGESTASGDETDRGAALFVQGGGATVFTSCTFVRCASREGSAIWSEGAQTIRIVRCILSDLTGTPLLPVLGAAAYDVSCSDFYGIDDPLVPGDFGRVLPGADNFIAEPLFCDAANGDFHLLDNSRCAPGRSPCGERVGALDTACQGRGVYVATRSSGLTVEGDGVPATSDAWFDWTAGSLHEISVAEVQDTPSGVRYIFRDWSDGGAPTHAVRVDPGNDTFVARQDSLFRLSMTVEGSGTVTPGTQWLAPSSVVAITAVADSGWAFAGWRGFGAGSFSGLSPTGSVTLERPIEEIAEFRPAVALTITSEPAGLPVRVDGIPHMTPVTLLEPRDTHLLHVELDSLVTTGTGQRARFQSWNVGGGTGIYVDIADVPVDLHAQFVTEYELAFEDTPNVELLPGNGWHAAGETAEIRAVPGYGWTFLRWVGSGSGAYTGTANPAPVTFDGPIHETPILAQGFPGHGLEMRISASATDPYMSTASPTGEPRLLYLWLTCSEIGLSAIEMSVRGTLPVYGFEPGELVLNAGTPTNLLLAVGGCPTGRTVERLLGHWTTFDTGGTLCVGPTPSDSVFATVDCEPVEPMLWPGPRVTGYASDGSSSCVVGYNACVGPTALALSGLVATPGNRTVVVSWFSGDGLGADRFRIYRSEPGATDFAAKGGEPTVDGGGFVYTDADVRGDRIYEYVVGVVDSDGHEERFGPVRVTTPDWPPLATRFEGLRPNPSSGRVDLRFSLAQRSAVRLSVYDVTGRRVAMLLDKTLDAGEHAATWDGRAEGVRVSSGIYFARFEVGGRVTSRKVTIVDAR